MSVLNLAGPSKVSLLSVVLAICLLQCVALSQKRRSSQEAPGKLEVKIFYETLCSDSVMFLDKQFHPSMSEKGRYNYTDIQFVPYGKVWSKIDPITNETILRCQHGVQECDRNALHACIIENTSKDEAYKLIICLMGYDRQSLKQCNANNEINMEEVDKCHKDRTITDILKKYGEETNELSPTFIPTIQIDGVRTEYFY